MPISHPVRRRLFAGVLLCVSYAVISVRRCDAPDRVFVLDAPLFGVQPRTIPPGWTFAPWLLTRVTSYPAGPATLSVDLSGTHAAVSREGARLEVEVDLTYRVEDAARLAREGRRGAAMREWLSDLVRSEASSRLAKASYDVVRNRDPEFQRSLESALDARTSPAGMRVARLRLVQVAAAGEGSGEILKAESTPLDREVVVIGIDSFTWRIADPLMQAGRMPNLARLVGRGVRANLRTISPILSPVIWTSIATGVKPSRHGIVDFVVTARDTGALLPVTSAMRQVPTLWNLMSRQGVEVAVVAWWATWPAETVRGRMVTDRVAYELFQESMNDDWKNPDPARNRAKTYPEDLFETLRPLIRAPSEISDDEVAAFLPAGRRLQSVSAEQRKRLDDFRTILAAGETYHAIARSLFKGSDARLKMIYYEGPDTTSHLFMRYRPPRLPGVSSEDQTLFGQVVDRYYEKQDRFIGEILETAGPEATILLLSDHGFKSDNNRPPESDPGIDKGNAADWHTPVGMLVMAGPDVQAGVDIGSASVLDVTPTILALYGLPVARDMDGQPLTQAFTERFTSARPVRWVDTYGGFRQTPQEIAAAPSAEDGEIVARLRNIGYIGEERMTARNNRGVIALDDGDVDGAIAEFEKALASSQEGGANIARTNLARAWMQKGDLDKARSFAQQAIAEDRRNKQAETILAGIDGRAHDDAGAERHLRRALEIDPTFVPALGQMGHLEAKRGRYAEALQAYLKVVGIAPLSAPEHNSIGEIYRKLGQTDKAMEAYRDALRCDAQYFGAYNNLGLCLQEKGRLDEARALYDKGLAIRPENPILRNSLGTLLALKGDRDGAIEEFRRAGKADPDWPVAAGNLATLLFESGRFEEARQAFVDWTRLEPDSIEARLGLGLDLLMLQRQDEAIAAFNLALQKDPRNVRGLIALGETLARRGDLEAAQANLEAAARVEPGIARIYNGLGDVLLRRGLKREAGTAFRRSLSIDPKQPEIRQRLAAIPR